MFELERPLGSGAALAWVALSLAACAGDTASEQPVAAPPCTNGRYALLDGFSAERRFDYLGDYADGVLIASTGTPCSGAPHPDRCAAAFALAEQSVESHRALITTESDVVRGWNEQSLVGLFGDIDTVAEALYLAASFGYSFGCDARPARVDAGFRFWTLGVMNMCFSAPASRIEVDATGAITEVATGYPVSSGGCARAGRGGI